VQLKDFQQKTLRSVSDYLIALSDARAKYERFSLSSDADVREMAKTYDFPAIAWKTVFGTKSYYSQIDGRGRPLPEFYLNLPTGAGKTLLACHVIDLVNRLYKKDQRGVVLWIVPTDQIYRQTLIHLRRKDDPYRQVLDNASGDKTHIREKNEVFTVDDVAENLCVILLMLPSANRENKETLRMFRDSGGYTSFFPGDDEYAENEKLLNRVPNLDCFQDPGGLFQRVVKTSLGNTLRLLNPIVVLDEGHKMYSTGARSTIRGFNPLMIIELSATPPEKVNILHKVSGRDLNDEEMIKLDIHLANMTTVRWQDVVAASVSKRDGLEKVANKYEQNTGVRIRPINLVQVERTGTDQRHKGLIHAEDVKDYLVKTCGVAEAEVAIKSSQRDDIEGIDLLASDCQIRYIITKQALQEGWDCAFAYILTVLANPSSKVNLTQLVGRVIRQPSARKTRILELDESYVICFRRKAAELVNEVRRGLDEEGLEDLKSHIKVDTEGQRTTALLRKAKYRKAFKGYTNRIYLPVFATRDYRGRWRELRYDVDILSLVDWHAADISSVQRIIPTEEQQKGSELRLGFDKSNLLVSKGVSTSVASEDIDEVFITRQIMEIVDNPWIAYEIGHEAIEKITKKSNRKLVSSNIVYIVEELRKILIDERDRLAHDIFKRLISEKLIVLLLLPEKGSFVLPTSLTVRSTRQLVKNDNTPLEKSLFDYVAEEEFNELEKAVALCLEDQAKLLWWYRNVSITGYYIQGWKRNRIYPDFIFAKGGSRKVSSPEEIHILETKGLFLKNEDTEYKKQVFEFINGLGVRTKWDEIEMGFATERFVFQLVFEDDWRNKLNEIFK
jgi:type III restriction enzyme